MESEFTPRRTERKEIVNPFAPISNRLLLNVSRILKEWKANEDINSVFCDNAVFFIITINIALSQYVTYSLIVCCANKQVLRGLLPSGDLAVMNPG